LAAIITVYDYFSIFFYKYNPPSGEGGANQNLKIKVQNCGTAARACFAEPALRLRSGRGGSAKSVNQR